MSWIEWYNTLEKPAWTPAPTVIGQIWGMLYPILFLSLAFVLIQAIRGKLPWKVLIPFGINLVANLIFTPIQFGLRNLPLASLDILLIWVTILWMIVAVWKFSRWVAVVQVPYFVWVSIATVLQLTITWKNW
jgi:tryptophan-rich sensory protein